MEGTQYYGQVADFKDFATKVHDIDTNHKYDKNLPYSFHLSVVAAQAVKYGHLLENHEERALVQMGAWGHDLIEDARLTYNDIKNQFGEPLAEIIYCCTELRGRNRSERHGQAYFDELRANRLATFVKLCDVIGNVKFGFLMNNLNMLPKYRTEFPIMSRVLWRDEFAVMFKDLEAILNLK